jgi:hypothetical protein
MIQLPLRTQMSFLEPKVGPELLGVLSLSCDQFEVQSHSTGAGIRAPSVAEILGG